MTPAGLRQGNPAHYATRLGAGLRPGETAAILITKVTHTNETFWKIDRTKPDVTLPDAGRYASAEDALRMQEKLYYPS
jgi:hypothetical protein